VPGKHDLVQIAIGMAEAKARDFERRTGSSSAPTPTRWHPSHLTRSP